MAMWHKWAVVGAIPATAAVAIAITAVGNVDRTSKVSTDPLDEQIHRGATVEQYVARLVGMLRQLDRTGDGLDKDDVELARDRMMAARRASAISQMLQSDLDGDFKVTRAEIERTAMGEDETRSRRVDAELGRYDTDGDGVITLKEAAAKAVARNMRSEDQGEGLLALDPNGDGKLTAEELRKLTERHFATIDKNGDGEISTEEYAPIAERRRAISMERSIPVCTLPAVPAGAQLVVYGGYEGDAISSAVIGGADEETNLIDVKIERGSAPLYLILTSYESMVWRFSGDTKRVVRVVTSSLSRGKAEQSLSGIAGIPRDRVTIAEPGCPRYFYDSNVQKRTAALATVVKALGREPDAAFGSYSAQSVSLPSGQVVRANAKQAVMPHGFDPVMWRDAVGFWPGGLVSVDPRSVVATARVEPYKVLPSQMGLAQLIGAGSVTMTSGRSFRIVRPIPHLPPSMGGAHSVLLELAENVPMPPGDPVHTCIRSAKTKQPTVNAMLCRHWE